MSSAAVITGGQVSLWYADFIFAVYIPDVNGSLLWLDLFSLFCLRYLHSGSINLDGKYRCLKAPFSSTSLPRFTFCFTDNSHSNRDEMLFHCTLDLHFSVTSTIECLFSIYLWVICISSSRSVSLSYRLPFFKLSHVGFFFPPFLHPGSEKPNVWTPSLDLQATVGSFSLVTVNSLGFSAPIESSLLRPWLWVLSAIEHGWLWFPCS